ncbi:hypothetical protein HanRHA438_Chr08g0352841 [Helianthus annuus]|nr:hypothetical protein HanRHA438_Chr08g0352841 [Helianthus annuus]
MSFKMQLPVVNSPLVDFSLLKSAKTKMRTWCDKGKVQQECTFKLTNTHISILGAESESTSQISTSSMVFWHEKVYTTISYPSLKTGL